MDVYGLPSLDAWVQSMGTYSGRDKAIRSIYFLLQLHAQKSAKGKEWMVIAKQLSTARLVLRQLNLPTTIKSIQQLVPLWKSVDKYDFACISTITGAYSVYWFVELFAWLSDAKVMSMDSGRIFRYCLYLWLMATIAGIARFVRVVYRKGVDKCKDDLLSLVGLLCDALTAVNSLPHKVLWAGQLSVKHTATASLIASVIAWSKTF